MDIKHEILEILRDDATISNQTIAALLGIAEEQVAAPSPNESAGDYYEI